MKKQQLLLTTAALSLCLSTMPAFAASSAGDSKSGASSSAARQADCKDLKGTALAACLEQQKQAGRTPGRSEDSASRVGGRTPGRSEDSASRTGTAPGKIDSAPMGAPAAGGTPKGSGSSTKK